MEASMEDSNQATQATMDPSSISTTLERGLSGEENPAAMTIEFLRARLLSERSVSKAARERAQQLSKKVTELEERLDAETELRKKLEADRLEILVKCRAELGDEYGDLFSSSLGEGLSRDESALDSPRRREDYTNEEEILAYTPDQDGEALPSNRLNRLDRCDSSPQLGHEEAHNQDDESNHSGQEKGVLSWGRHKGLRKEFAFGTEWIGRSFSPRSRISTDVESPLKKWAGKSVRQIRKTGIRPSGTNEEENEQKQSLEECDSKIDQPNAMGAPFPDDDERDTEVEWVLERQAELIEQYEDEENAQRAWEAKFKEGKVLSNFKTGKVITPSNSEGKLDAMPSPPSQEQGLIAKDEAAQLAETAETKSSLPESDNTSNDSVTKHFSKVHPEDTQKESEDGSLQSLPQNTSQDNDEPPGLFERNAACFQPDQVGVSILNQESVSADKSAECLEDSKMDARLSVDVMEDPAVRPAQNVKLSRHLSSSFKFSVLPDPEAVSGSSPQMHGFKMYMQNAGLDEVTSKELVESNEAKDVSAVSGAHGHDANDGATTKSSMNNHVIAKDSSPMVDNPICSEDAHSQVNENDLIHQNTLVTERQRSQLPAKNYITVSSQNVSSSNSSSKDGENRHINGLEADKDSPDPGRHVSELPSYTGPRGSSSWEYLNQQNYPNLPRNDHSVPITKALDGGKFENNVVYQGNNRKPGSHVQGLHAPPFEERAFGSHSRSLDGFDRVADVLRVLELAKHHVQSSDDLDFPSSSDRINYDNRDAFYAEPPRLSTYPNRPQPYAASGAYSSREPAILSHNANGWGALPSGHGGLARQVTNGPYMHYPSRMPEVPSAWAPPSSGLYNSNMYQYDHRQHR